MSTFEVPLQGDRRPIFSVSREVRRKIDLLWLLTKKEVTLKYKRTVLGVVWSLLNPLLLTLVMLIAFSVFMRFQMEGYSFFLLSGLFPWNWFSASVTLSTGALISNVNLIKRIRVPRSFFVIAIVLSQLVNFLFAFPILIAIGYAYGGGLGVNWLIGIPILIVSQFMVTLGLCLAVSMLNAYFRDMEYIAGVFVGLLFWMTPIIFPLEMVPEAYRTYLALNPLAYLMSSWRDIFLHNNLNWGHLGIAVVSACIFLLIGIAVFQKLGKRLDEVL